MMCDFCKEEYITDSGFFRPFEEHDSYIFHDKDGFHINVDCGCGDYAELSNIQYCPMCGRKLGDEDV